MALIECVDCKNQISSEADKCPHCGRPVSTAIKCPNCKSTNVEKISSASKVGSALMWGIFAAGKLTKTYHCKNCKFRW